MTLDDYMVGDEVMHMNGGEWIFTVTKITTIKNVNLMEIYYEPTQFKGMYRREMIGVMINPTRLTLIKHKIRTDIKEFLDSI